MRNWEKSEQSAITMLDANGVLSNTATGAQHAIGMRAVVTSSMMRMLLSAICAMIALTWPETRQTSVATSGAIPIEETMTSSGRGYSSCTLSAGVQRPPTVPGV